MLHRLGPGPHLLQKCLETDIPRLGNSAHQRCRREVDALLSFPVRTHSIITFTQRMAASGHGSVAHRVKLRLMVHMVPGSNPAWDFLSGKREGGLKPPEWLLVHKGPSLSLVPSPGPRGCNCLCLAHVRKCCVFLASHRYQNWYFRTFYTGEPNYRTLSQPSTEAVHYKALRSRDCSSPDSGEQRLTHINGLVRSRE